LRSTLAIAASGEFDDEPIAAKPAGSRSTRSPWLIQTFKRAPSFASNGSLPVRSTSAYPYSR
jgi:hypothetical protein